jgi:hypothetical protein
MHVGLACRVFIFIFILYGAPGTTMEQQIAPGDQ